MDKETEKKLKTVLDTAQFLQPISVRLILNEKIGQRLAEVLKTWFSGRNTSVFQEVDYQFYRIMKSQSSIIIPSVEQSRLLSNLTVGDAAAIFLPLQSEYGYCGCFWGCFPTDHFSEQTQTFFENLRDWINEIIANGLQKDFSIQTIANHYADFLVQLNIPALIVTVPGQVSISNSLFESMQFKEKVLQLIRNGLADSNFTELFELYHCDFHEINFPDDKKGKLFLFHSQQEFPETVNAVDTNEIEYVELLIRKISGTLDLLNDAGELNLMQKNYRGVADTELDRLSRIVQYKKKHLLNFRNPREYIFETMEIGEIIKEVVYDIKPIARKKKLDLVYEIEKIEGSRSQSGKIIGDPWLLTLAVYNLIDNAVRYSKPESKPVKVDLAYRVDTWVLRIQDDGIGISPLDLQKIRDDGGLEAQDQKIAATANGIQFVKYVAKLHKGTLSVDSKLGKGSVFTFEAPYY